MGVMRMDTAAVEGLLNRLPERVAKNVTVSSLRQGANVIVKRARLNVAANGNVDSGMLIKKIGTRAVKKSDKGTAVVAVTIKPGSAQVVRKGKLKKARATPRRYAHLIEFGKEGFPAHSFMRTAVGSSGQQAAAKVVEAAAKGINRETAKLATGKTSFVTGKKIA